MVAIVSPPLLQTVLTLLMSEVWASDRKVFFGISIRPLKHGQLFIRLYYHKSVSYTLAKERMRYLWSDSVLAKLKTISVVHEPCTVPMPTPPHSYQQNAHLYIRLGTSIDRHVLAKKASGWLAMFHYTITTNFNTPMYFTLSSSGTKWSRGERQSIIYYCGSFRTLIPHAMQSILQSWMIIQSG
jgi:hypothetical protein